MLILASKSPRRRELLSLIAESFGTDSADGEEEKFSSGAVSEYVMRLALAKAEEVAPRHAGDVILSADTVVALSGRVLGKPADEGDAVRMLKSLSGRAHEVFTGVCVMGKGKTVCDFVRTEVVFRRLSDGEIYEYVKTGDPLDKAGAYGIQGGAGRFVSALHGDYFNVIGLPLKRVSEILKREVWA